MRAAHAPRLTTRGDPPHLRTARTISRDARRRSWRRSDQTDVSARGPHDDAWLCRSLRLPTRADKFGVDAHSPVHATGEPDVHEPADGHLRVARAALGRRASPWPEERTHLPL